MSRVVVIIFLAAHILCHAAEDTMTGVFDAYTRSVQAVVDNNMFAPLVIDLDGQSHLTVSFDRLADDREFLRYSLTHCDARWQPSGLTDSEILDSFNEANIEDYRFSETTTVPYVHYTFDIPGHGLRPLLSGNYLLKVYSETDPDETLFQLRFGVCEYSAKADAEVSARTDIDFQEAHQQVSVTVDTDGARVEDPFNDLTVTVTQNNRADTETSLRQPLRVSGTRAIFEHRQPWIFDAGNEYRRFETSSVHYPGMGVEEIRFEEPYYHMTLATDYPRSAESYLYDSTQKGRFVVREYNSDDSDVAADYAIVHFRLDYPDSKAVIFLDGDMTQRRFDSGSRMVYNPATGLFEKALLLKQGAYNYQYLTVPPGDRCGHTAPVEGDKFQTQNEYTVRVYHRQRGERYDRLIATTICKP